MPSAAFFRSLGLYAREDFLDLEACVRLREEMRGVSSEPGTVVREYGGVVDAQIRKVRLANISAATVRSVYERFVNERERLEQHFDATLDGCHGPEFLVYHPGDFHQGHRDANASAPAKIARRRVSLVVFLNPPAAEPAPECFGGGELTFYGLMQEPGWDKCAFAVDAKPGMLLAFRSETFHEVRPVTFGIRYTIAGWLTSKPSHS